MNNHFTLSFLAISLFIGTTTHISAKPATDYIDSALQLCEEIEALKAKLYTSTDQEPIQDKIYEKRSRFWKIHPIIARIDGEEFSFNSPINKSDFLARIEKALDNDPDIY